MIQNVILGMIFALLLVLLFLVLPIVIHKHAIEHRPVAIYQEARLT